MELQFIIFGACLLACGTAGSNLKSSLTFVIDENDSMYESIKEVIEVVDKIVTNSSSSPVEDFVLVTFNDEVKLATKTNDKAEFTGNISDINFGGGDPCSKKTLAGIELALNESRDGSLLYVFTNGPAEDYNQTDKIQALSQKKGVQIVFFLTGVCPGSKTSPNYLVYHDIAEATNGQVFHLQKYELGEILKYVNNTIESRKNIIASRTFQAGEENTFDVNVDGDTDELVIAVSGESPTVTVTSGGVEVNATNIARLHDIAVVKVPVKPGQCKVEVSSKSESRVVVSASTSVQFQHGFSIITPSAITDTSKKPIPRSEEELDLKSYLSIQLGPGGANVKLRSAQILNMEDVVLIDQPLKLVDKDKQFYTTKPLVTPDDMFKIAINGYDTKKEINVTLYGLTPIEPQSNTERAMEKKPEVTIDGAPTIKPHYYKPLKLKCKVSGWPTPHVIWTSSDKSDKLLFDKVSKMELPDKYISVLEILKVTKNATYTCNATNSEGITATNITVQTVETQFIEVEAEDTTIEYQKPGRINCNVNAYPPANITWYKAGTKAPLKPSENLTISADGSIISIKAMQPKMAGNYYCLAKNSKDKKVKPLKVKISGVGPPKIDKSVYHLSAPVTESVDIKCEVTSTPNATLQWSFKNATTYIALNETSDTITFEDLETTHGGTYSCKAENEYGVDYHGIELIVEYEPSISRNASEQRVKAVEGHTVLLNCSSDGVPAPDITWTHKGFTLNTIRHSFYTNGSLGFSAVHSDEGTYTCEVRNDVGSDTISIDLEVITPVAVESPVKTKIDSKEGTPLTLNCTADGTPAPNITWLYRNTPKANVIHLHNHGQQLNFARVQHGQSGEYTCVATNEGGSKNLTYVVSVTAPPSILYTMKTFRGVVGDMYLRVPCDATGNPKPKVLWTWKNNTQFDLASDTEWYLVAEDGSLIIKNISKWAEGYYTCTVSNEYGSASEVFTVLVDPFPIEYFISIQIEEGKSANIPCSVPYKHTDRLRWFKDNVTISSTELHNVTTKDGGTYTCRVSSVDRPPQTGSTKVEVGFQPRFVHDDAKNIPYRYGGWADMDCTAKAKPAPQVSWLHDGIAINDVTEFRHQFMMVGEYQKGSYTCIVKNQYGYAQKDFIISSADAA